MAEVLQAFSLQQGQFQPKFQVDGDPHQPFFLSEN